jgi:N-acetylglucosamine-6-phosphate deacetylase
MSFMDPHMRDGTYDWRDGRKVVKEGVKLYIAGSDTLAGRYDTV